MLTSLQAPHRTLVMKILILFIASLSTPYFVHAEADLKQNAQFEIETSKTVNMPAGQQSKVNKESLLRLTDSYQSPRAREFNWLAGFEFSNFKTSGKKYLGAGAYQAIDDRNNFIPRLSFGTRYNLIYAGPHFSSWFLGMEAGAALSTDAQKVQIANRTIEASLNHTMLDLGIKTSLAFSRYPRLNLGYSLAVGQASSTQTADDSLGDWTELTPYRQSTLSADYDFSHGWYGTLAFGQRENIDAGKALDMAQTQWRTGLGFVW